jgi:DNA repair protein RadA/Sms
MARPSTVFTCSACGGEALKWQGQCPHCAEWNTLSAQVAGRAGVPPPTTLTLSDTARRGTGHREFDRVMGGGLVGGSVTLLGGDPGIGKSTLLTQVATHVSQSGRVLYASGEESAAQVGLRAARLGLSPANIQVFPETDLDAILAAARSSALALLVIDSIQTVQLARVDSSAGGVSQLRECAGEIVRFAKSSGVPVVIVGHVTKDGALAGPRVLEHLVDVVLYFESERSSRFRVVRATKNRFGAAGELAFFAMTETGLREVANPAAIFLARPEVVAPGSIVMVAREGSRPLLVEIQALVDAMRFGNPRRVAQGLDAGRLSMLLAVLNRHAGVSLQDYDVFANVVGGLQIDDTATDLPLALALASSLRDRALPDGLVAFGEIGLTGEVRPVAYGEERLREAARQGFRQALVPKDNVPRKPLEGIAVRGVVRLAEALEGV